MLLLILISLNCTQNCKINDLDLLKNSNKIFLSTIDSTFFGQSILQFDMVCEDCFEPESYKINCKNIDIRTLNSYVEINGDSINLIEEFYFWDNILYGYNTQFVL